MIDDCESPVTGYRFKRDERPIRSLGLKVFNIIKDFRAFLNTRTLRKLEGGVRKFRGFRGITHWAPRNCRKFLQTPMKPQNLTQEEVYLEVKKIVESFGGEIITFEPSKTIEYGGIQ